MNLKKILLISISVLAFTVNIAAYAESLTDDSIKKYIQAYKELKKIAPDLSKDLAKGKVSSNGIKGFNEIEKVVKNAGFSNYADFVRTNASIAWAFSKIQGDKFMNTTDKNVKSAIEEIEKKLKDPNLPSSVKNELKKQEEKIKKDYSKNKSWGDWVMKGVSKFTNRDKKSLDLVQKYSKELESTFQGK